MPTMKVMIETDIGTEHEITLPARYEVCGRCEGEGTHLHPDIGEYAYSQEEFDREFSDEEREAYFTRGGMYDVTCYDCNGLRVVLVLDKEELEDRPRFRLGKMRLGKSRARILRRIHDEERVRAEIAAEDAAERRYFAMFER